MPINNITPQQPPPQPQDIYELGGRGMIGQPTQGSGFQSSSGGATIGQVPINNRDAFFTRNLMSFLVPGVGQIEMYINPQNISIDNKKIISTARTKGGFVSQYWGEDLTAINIGGTTGSSGIEGINVLENVYRSEQLAFDPYALALSSNRETELSNDSFSFLGDFPTNSLGSTLDGFGKSFLDLATNAMETGSYVSTRQQPTLASLAFSVELYWSGTVYRGWFTNFRVDERAEKIGLFDYQMTFMAVQKRGIRTNFFGWHRSATSGSSYTDPVLGRPYSYNGLYAQSGGAPVLLNQSQENNSLVSSLQSSIDYISSIF